MVCTSSFQVSVYGLGDKSIATTIVFLIPFVRKYASGYYRIFVLPDSVVVLIGSSASAYDISREIATVAKEVHVAARSTTNGTPTKLVGYNNLWTHSMIKSAHKDGTVLFEDGSLLLVDVILHCTGYVSKTGNIVIVDDNRVAPLYQHVFPPQLAPWLSFIGLPWKVIPFPLVELQSKWVAGILSGRISLPSQEEMMSDVEAFYLTLEAAGVPKRYTHNLGNCQFEYNDWLAAECRSSPSQEWRKQMYAANRMNRAIRPETYRDDFEDQNLIWQAHQDFLQYIPAASISSVDRYKQNPIAN
ncbi:hypothetical protein IFM89_014167 [Coptis chinensis]|uniref:Flavin-containing monooxygenase n=1 Tax=Coptis chinensis TaxID=261450 RepID=A0A835M4U5_9MAGN|nr:hypothetical protein IFM89_014167 [Coptis chinensis]